MSTLDKKYYFVYHSDMQKIAIIGGGASGMACAVLLARKGLTVTVLERGERLGRKLSASGNGQGNVTNRNMGKEFYFSDDLEKVGRLLSRFGSGDAVRFLESMGGVFLPDPRGRVYPAGRQASAVTDLLRGEMARLGVNVVYGAHVRRLTYEKSFSVFWDGGGTTADKVVLAAGGKAAPNFGTDGSAYALAERFGHSVTPCAPVLVQLKCDPAAVRGLKGIRVDGALRVFRGGERIYENRGDVLFTESGISGDATFRASSHAKQGDRLEIDLLPEVSEERLLNILQKGGEERLLCVVNNGLGRVLYKRAGGNATALAALIKRFPLEVTGTLGYAYAQVTRGGIPLKETDENLMSIYRKDLYFTGEILNADGECGGYNLQWAFTSAFAAAEGILL